MRNKIDFNNQKVQGAINVVMGIVGPDRPVVIVGPDRTKIAGYNRIIIVGPDKPPIPDPPPDAIVRILIKAVTGSLTPGERKIALARANVLKNYATKIEKMLGKSRKA